MAPVYKLSASSVTGRTTYGSMLAGNPVYVPTSYESIATYTVGAGGAANVEFTSIPSTYKHLQIRGILKDNGGSSGSVYSIMRLNSDTGSNYNWHILLGDGSSASASDGGGSQTLMFSSFTLEGSANVFSAAVIDILDYANGNKYKTVRSLSGWDANGSGRLGLGSGLWMSTSAITSITLDLRGDLSGSFPQYSHFALYGIKGAA